MRLVRLEWTLQMQDVLIRGAVRTCSASVSMHMFTWSVPSVQLEHADFLSAVESLIGPPAFA
jgi:hypothetical protein